MNKIITGFDQIDKHFKGGLLVPSFNIVGGISTSGKTSFLISLSKNILDKNKKVKITFISFQLIEKVFRQKFIMNLCDDKNIDYMSDDVKGLNDGQKKEKEFRLEEFNNIYKNRINYYGASRTFFNRNNDCKYFEIKIIKNAKFLLNSVIKYFNLNKGIK